MFFSAGMITKIQENSDCSLLSSDPGQLLVRCGEWDTQTNSEPLPHQDRKVSWIDR